jgi:perosamine synthetase
MGHDWLMTEFQAALGLAQLRRLPHAIEKRMEIARRYDEAFADLPHVRIFPLPMGATSGYYKYPVRIEAPLKKSSIKATLESQGISVGNSYWPPIHLQPVYRQRFGYKEGDFPIAEKILNCVLTLPLHPGMTESEITRVIEGFQAATE